VPSGRERSGEQANTQSFLNELCDLLNVPRPDPTKADNRDNAYVYERPVPFDDGDGSHTTKFIDLYKRGCFVLEAKQGSDSAAGVDGPMLFTPSAKKSRKGTAVRNTPAWDAAMLKARAQAERYVRMLPADEGNPPFIVVTDVGHTFELFADFSRLG